MIVVIGNTKGGVGKTTLATQLALARQADGRTVLLIDADRQGSAQGAATARAEGGRTPPLACVCPSASRTAATGANSCPGSHV